MRLNPTIVHYIHLLLCCPHSGCASPLLAHTIDRSFRSNFALGSSRVVGKRRGRSHTRVAHAMADRRTRVEALYRDLRSGSGYTHVPEVWPKELHARLVQDASSFRPSSPSKLVLVDVRERDERNVSRLHRCAISRDECMAMLRDGRLQDRDVVAYCTVGHRSGMFASRLRASGVDAKNLVGSVLLWTHEGYPLVDEHDQETRHVHVYSQEWSLVGDGYQPVWYARAPTFHVATREIKERLSHAWHKLTSRARSKRNVEDEAARTIQADVGVADDADHHDDEGGVDTS